MLCQRLYVCRERAKKRRASDDSESDEDPDDSRSAGALGKKSKIRKPKLPQPESAPIFEDISCHGIH